MAAVALGRRLFTSVKKISTQAWQNQSKTLLRGLCPSAEITLERSYRGSNRMKRLKAEREKAKLEKQLEIKYGIKNEVDFNFHKWIKENFFKELTAFQNRIGVIFDDEKLLASAFAHASFCDEIETLTVMSNSEDTSSSDIQIRLEISGHLSEITSEKLSLLGFESTSVVIKEHLYKRYTNMTTAIGNDVWKFLTNREIITSLACNLGLEDYILMSRELETLNGNLDDEFQLNYTKEDILSDTFFALIGAIEKDLGHSEVKSFVEDFILPHLDHTDLTQHVNMEDPHGELMKIFSLHGVNTSVRARTIVETGVDSHFPFYQVGIFCKSLQIGEGSGHSASIARMNAFKNSVFQCLENEVDFTQFKRK